MIRIMRACLFASLTALSGSALAAPCAGFTDVDDTSPGIGSGYGSVCWGVEWVRNRGITLGCTDASHYCPLDSVSRAQMALFMARLGAGLTPVRQFVDANPGAVTIQGGSYGIVCQSPPFLVASIGGQGFPRTAVVHGLAWGLVDAPVVWTADLWVSTDFGANFAPMTNYIPFNAATAAGGTQGTTFAYKDLAMGHAYVFAMVIRKSADGPNGTGNFTDLACHMMVEFGNRISFTPPFDAPASQGAGGSLRANH
jgi:hypothetical protein